MKERWLHLSNLLLFFGGGGGAFVGDFSSVIHGNVSCAFTQGQNVLQVQMERGTSERTRDLY